MASLPGKLERLLPELRRYAFGLTGATHVGDQLVETCMHAATEAPWRLDRQHTRQSLYRLFHEVNPSVPIGTPPTVGLPAIQDRMLNYLLGLPLPDRAILALHTAFGFPHEEIADILNLAREEVVAILTATQQRLARAELARVLVIEDDYILASDIAYAIEQGGRGICGPVGTYDEAIRCAAEDAPGFVVADIQLRDGQFTGIEAAEVICRAHAAPVIFITAFPERVVMQMVPGPSSVLTKPVDYRVLGGAIARRLAAPV
jgi:DNA-directed RNA polymerase specialized sigma24 family protein